MARHKSPEMVLVKATHISKTFSKNILTIYDYILLISLCEQIKSEYSRRNAPAIQGCLYFGRKRNDQSCCQDRSGLRQENRKETEKIIRGKRKRYGCRPNRFLENMNEKDGLYKIIIPVGNFQIFDPILLDSNINYIIIGSTRVTSDNHIADSVSKHTNDQ